MIRSLLKRVVIAAAREIVNSETAPAPAPERVAEPKPARVVERVRERPPERQPKREQPKKPRVEPPALIEVDDEPIDEDEIEYPGDDFSQEIDAADDDDGFEDDDETDEDEREDEDVADDDSDNDDDDEIGFDERPAFPTRHEIIIALGLKPIERPFFREAVRQQDGKGDKEQLIETGNDAVDARGRPIPLDDGHFAVHLRRSRREFAHLKPESIDVETQLPIFRHEKVAYGPSASTRGITRSWIGAATTPADLEMAKIGWVRYFASGGGPAAAPEQGLGTFYEGYVPLLATAKPWKEALAVAKRLNMAVLVSPKACVHNGVLFGAKPAPWLLIKVQPQLAEKLARLRE